MLFNDIKNYFIENEELLGKTEEYLHELEQCASIEELREVVIDFNGLSDEFEASNYILNKVCI